MDAGGAWYLRLRCELQRDRRGFSAFGRGKTVSGPRASMWPQRNACHKPIGARGIVDIHLDIIGLNIEMLGHQPNDFTTQTVNGPWLEARAIVR